MALPTAMIFGHSKWKASILILNDMRLGERINAVGGSKRAPLIQLGTPRADLRPRHQRQHAKLGRSYSERIARETTKVLRTSSTKLLNF